MQHVQRIGEDRLPKLVMACCPIGRQKRKCRPKGIQMDGILGMMEEKGFKEDDWRDREKW